MGSVEILAKKAMLYKRPTFMAGCTTRRERTRRRRRGRRRKRRRNPYFNL